MSGFDDILEQLDEQLKDKKEVEVYAIIFIIFLAIAGLTWSYIFPITEGILTQAKKSRNDIAKKVAVEQSYLNQQSVNGDSQFYVTKSKAEVDVLTKKVREFQSDNEYINYKLEDLKYLLYDKENWSKFVDSISKLANDYNLDIKKIESKFYDLDATKKEIKQVLDIEIDVEGDYKKVLKFINSLEESKLVVDLYNFNLTRKIKVNAKLKVSVWGMVY